jgi:hypothetical protein
MQELLPRVRTNGVAEECLIVAPLNAIMTAILFVAPAFR